MRILVSTFLIILSWTSVQCDNQRDKVFFLQKSSGPDNETLLVVTWIENKSEYSAGCEIFTDEELIKEVLLSSDDSPIRTLSEDEMQNLLGDCTEFTLRRRRRDSEDETATRLSIDDIDDDTATRLSIDDIDDDPKELRGNDGGRRSPQNARGQNGGGRRAPQNARNQNSDGRRTTQNNRSQNRNGRRQNGGSTRAPQNAERRNGNGRISKPSRVSTTWSTNSIETRPVTPMKADFRNKTTTAIPMNEVTGTSTKAKDDYDTTTEAPTTVQGYNGINIIFPGTKWCGAGARAKSYTDLGSSEETDKCCRAHDICNDTLAPGETRNNLTNTSPFTKLSCQCDQAFYDCLDQVDNMASNTVGNMYFNILRRECYMKDYPKSKTCKKYLTIFKLTCSEYEKDTNAPKVYQWVPAKRYRKIAVPDLLRSS